MVALLLAASLAVATSLVGTKLLIDWLIAHKVGQPIHEDVPEGHRVKAGMPTMGGLAIVGAAIIGYLAAHVRSGLVFTRTGVLVMGCIAGAAAVGLIDDWIKVRSRAQPRAHQAGEDRRPARGGHRLLGRHRHWTDVETTLSFTRWTSPGWEMGRPMWCVWAVLLIYATTNGVNLTDGLDGLAAGSSIFAFSTLMVVGFWAFRHPDIYKINHALDLAVVAAAMLGGCAGFLWWNAAPARIIMGDTGALAIGAGLAALVAHAQRPAAPADRRRALRGRDRVGDPAGRELPHVQAAHLPHGARSTTTSSSAAGPRPP